MAEDIYRKALRLALDGRVELDVAEDRAWYYRVRGDTETHDVRLEASNTFNCTCMWGTLHAAKDGALCSHILAAAFHRAIHQGGGVQEGLGEADLGVLKGAMSLARAGVAMPQEEAPTEAAPGRGRRAARPRAGTPGPAAEEERAPGDA